MTNFEQLVAEILQERLTAWCKRHRMMMTSADESMLEDDLDPKDRLIADLAPRVAAAIRAARHPAVIASGKEPAHLRFPTAREADDYSILVALRGGAS